jgi:hypothetical protein
MSRTGLLIAGLGVVLLVTGCAVYSAPVVPPNAAVFTDISAPLGTEPHRAAGTPPTMGEASTQSVLGLFAWGDASMHAAADNGGLTTIEYADYKYLSVLWGLYSRFTVVAWGQ